MKTQPNDELYLAHLHMAEPIDDLTVVASNRGLVAILWQDDERWDFPRARREVNPIIASTIDQLEQYFAGERTEFAIPLDLRGTDFQLSAWNSLADIPFGETKSYGQQAADLGKPTAVRAVASANAKNPVSIVLPCHRVIATSGKLAGYAGGLDAKRWLLDHERNRLSGP